MNSAGGTSKLKIAYWVLLGACIICFVFAWTTNAVGWSVFFYIFLFVALLLLTIAYQRNKSGSRSVKTALGASDMKIAPGLQIKKEHDEQSEGNQPQAVVPPSPTIGTTNQRDEFNKQFNKKYNKVPFPSVPPAKPTVLTAAPEKPKPGHVPPPPPKTENTPVVNIPANLLNGRYEIMVKEYKRGGMAIISLAKDYRNKQKQVIIKRPRRDSDHAVQLNIEKLRQEGEYLRGVNHPNIIKFVDLFNDHAKNPNLVVDYIQGDDLLNAFKLKPADEHRTVKWTVQILNAMEYVHRSGVVHRDLNPGNIMMTPEDNVILIDFGTIKGSGYSSDTVFFKPGFNIPEVAAQSYADERSDIYGVGSILYYLLTCERPGFIRGRDIITLLSERGVSQRTCKCVAQALQFDPNFRFQTAAAMRRALLGE